MYYKENKKSRKSSYSILLIIFFNIFAISVLYSQYIDLSSNKYFNQNVLPVSNLSTEDIYLSPLGITVGIKVNTDGIMVLKTGDIINSQGEITSPSAEILAGDHIVFANNKRLETKEDLVHVVQNSDKIDFVIKRNNQIINVYVTPTITDLGEKKVGLWVRDMAQGIGTVTYYNPVSGKFGALGHGIMDSNTKELMDISGGEISLTSIENIKKGKKGSPGELVGYLDQNKVLGSINVNTSYGIFGYLNEQMLGSHRPIAIGRISDIEVGEAIVLSNIEGSIQAYSASIESINKNTADNSKGMVVKITDEDLLNRTNGIVQGMSGSPIIQNDKIIGAVTHVFVQDPTKGYGVFIENMLKQENAI